MILPDILGRNSSLMQKTTKFSDSGILIFLCAIGTLYPPLFVLAALFAAAMFFTRERSEKLSADVGVNILTVTKEHPDWKRYFFAVCESPAEATFLEAMINHHGFVPTDGCLSRSSLKLSMQEKIGNYRVDFLANNWLVIEIDGATYHGSPEAIARDKVRDEFLRGRVFLFCAYRRR